MDKKEMIAFSAFVGLCALAMLNKNEQALVGGIGDDTDEDDVDQDELEMGEEVELEHTNDRNIAREIALDHLTEDDHYYSHLKEMEKKYQKKK